MLDLKIGTDLPQQKEIMLFRKMILSLVFDQRLLLTKVLNFIFLKKYFICNDYSQLELARNLSYYPYRIND